MAGFLPADEPPKNIPVEIHDDFAEDSDILFENVDKTLRESRLAGIEWYKHVYLCNKALGLPTTDTPLSVIEETIFEDSIPETPVSSADLGLGVSSEAAVGDGGSTAEACGETAMEVVEDGSASNLEAPLYQADSGSRSLSEIPLSQSDLGFGLEAAALEYDRARVAELDPRAVEMMRIILPLYFQMVRSFLTETPLSVSLYWPTYHSCSISAFQKF